MMVVGIVERLAAMVSISRTRVKVSHRDLGPDGRSIERWGPVLLWSGNV